MKTIHKYTLEIADNQMIDMPQGAQILTVQVQNGMPCLWALVEDTMERVARRIYMRGTGHPANGLDVKDYVGTFQLAAGGLVFHVFQ